MCSITLSPSVLHQRSGSTQSAEQLASVSQETEPTIYWNLFLNDKAMTFPMHALLSHKFSQISFYISSKAFATKLHLHSLQPTGEDPVFPSSIMTFFYFQMALLEADKCFGSSKKGGIICPGKHTHFDSSFKGCPFLSLSSVSHMKEEREEKKRAWRGIYWLIANGKSPDVRAMWTSFSVLTDETAI